MHFGLNQYSEIQTFGKIGVLILIWRSGVMKQLDSDLFYMQMNKSEQYVLSHGITFTDFIKSMNNPIESVLLLEHKFDDVQLHLRSLFNYIEHEKIQDLIKEDVSSYGEFSWVDFDDIEALDELDGQEIAELLFLNHMKHPLRSAFFQKLNNRFVYLAHDDGWINKTYYRNLDDFYGVLRYIIMNVMKREQKHKGFMFFKKTSKPEPIDFSSLKNLSGLLYEGCVIDTEKVKSSRAKFEIPFYKLGTYWNMDEMKDAYENMKRNPDIVVTYNLKEKRWTLV